jgi:DNA repair exonuclease SbcCD ATPase subunit
MNNILVFSILFLNNFVTFREVSITNFLSIGSVEHFPLDQEGIYLVLGQNLDDPKSSSNGAGKSSLLESITWALYGKLPRFDSRQGTSDDVVNDAFGKDCSVTVVLTVGDKKYEITRYRKHSKYGGNGVLIFENGVNITRHTTAREGGNNDLILDIVKVPYEVFSSTLIIGQGLQSRFSILDDTQKKAVIESLRDSEYGMWIDCHAEANQRLGELDRRIKDFEETIRIKSGNVQFLSERLSTLENELTVLQGQVDSCNEENSDNSLDESIELLNNKKSFLENKQHLIEEEIESIKNSLEPVENYVLEESVEISVLLNEVNAKGSIVSSPVKKCNQCGTILSSISKEQLDQLESEYKELLSVLEEKQHEKQTKEQELQSLKGRLNTLSGALSTVQRELKTVVQDLADKRFELEQKRSKKELLNSLLLAKKNEVQSSISQISSIQGEIESLELERTGLVNRRPYLLALVKEAFSPKGIRAFLIARDINDLNRRLFDYSKVLFSDTVVYLKAGTEENVVTKISLEIKGRRDRTYSKLSQGEKRRVDIAVQFSLYDFIRENFKVRFNILVLDEIFENLDSEGIQSTMKLIQNFVKSGMCVFVISHNPSIKSLVRDTITVIKENGVSRLAV